MPAPIPATGTRRARRRLGALLFATALAGAAAVLTAIPVGAADFLENGGFESPASYDGSCGGGGDNPSTYDLTDVDLGTGKALGWYVTDDCLERWTNGFQGISAYEGTRFAELNATCKGALYQEFAVTPGQKILWQIAHAGRAGVESMRFYLGDATSATTAARCTQDRLNQALAGLVPQVPLTRNGVALNLDPTNPANAVLSDGAGDWGQYFGVYTVPAGVTTLRFALSSDDPGSEGNFVDAVAIQVPSGNLLVRKTANASEVAPIAGSFIEYTIAVTTDDSIYGPIEVTDSRANTLDCEGLSEVGDGDNRLEDGETLYCTATVTLTALDIRRGKVRNTVTATGNYGISEATDTVTVKIAPTIAVLLDESGSIETNEGIWLRRYNRVLRDFQRLTSVAPYHLTRFNSRKFQREYVGIAIEDAARITPEQFNPAHTTNLYDAATKMIRQLSRRDPIGRVIVALVSDGGDNASVRATRESLAKLIRSKERGGWSFLYVGAGALELQAQVAAIAAAETEPAPAP